MNFVRSRSNSELKGCYVTGGLGLDLKSLAQEEPEEEGRDKRLKLAYFDQHFSEVHPNIFVVGETLAKNEAALQAQGITHIVNCIGMILNPMFPDSFSYLTLHLLGEVFVSTLLVSIVDI